MPTPATAVDLAAVRVGVTETRTWWRVPLLGHHLLVAGPPGPGKGVGVVVADRRHRPCRANSGVVRLCVIDPKGGMELGAGVAMFSFFSHEATGRTVELLRALVS